MGNERGFPKVEKVKVVLKTLVCRVIRRQHKTRSF